MSDPLTLKEQLKKELLKGRYKKALKLLKKVEELEGYKEKLNLELLKALILQLDGRKEEFDKAMKEILEKVIPSEAPELESQFMEVIKRHSHISLKREEPKRSVQEFLSIFTFMEELPRDALGEMVRRITPPTIYKKGEFLCREGEKGDRMYFIAKGEVVVTKKGVWLTHLSRGDLLGEMAFFSDEKERTADVVALTDVEVFELSYRDLEELFSRFPGLEEMMKRIFSRRMKETLVASSKGFSEIKPKIRKRLAERGEMVAFRRGDVVVEACSEEVPLFIIAKGTVGVYRNGEKIAELREGDAFGWDPFPFRAVVESDQASLLKIDPEDAKAAFKGYEEILEEVRGAICKGSS